MPIGLDKAPNALPKEGQKLWVDTFNGVLENCEGPPRECDERAARVAWDQTKRQYRKVKDKWIAKSEYEDSYHDLLLIITKASLQPDGSVRWQAVASDTGPDKADERTSVELFQDWIDRVTWGQTVDYLPPPKMPFLGVSHYPSLDGFGEAGSTYKMYIDGDCFKADGVFNFDNPIGEKLLNAVKVELALIKKGETIEKPIRISAGWWDIQHLHKDSNFLFTRQSLVEKCPLCEKGQTADKVYKAGQLDHFAATRVPMNVRTSLELKSMAKITRQEDAESIIGSDEAKEMEKRARMVGKSDIDEELPGAMVVRADDEDEEDMKPGAYMRKMREKKNMKRMDLAKFLKMKEDRLKRLEDDEDDMDIETMGAIAEALKMSDDEIADMSKRYGKKKRPMPEKSAVEELSKDEPAKMHYGEGEAMAMMPFGGAKSLKEAEDYIATQEKMSKMYSYWDMLKSAYQNIQSDYEMEPGDKLKAVSSLFREMGSKIDTLKAGLSDAFLIQQSTAAYSEFDDDDDEDAEIYYDDEDDIMSDNQTQAANHPADKLKTAVELALKNKSLGRQAQEAAVQEAFNEYAQTVQSELDQANPLPVGDQIAGAIEKAMTNVLGPLAEQVGLLAAKVSQQDQPHPQSGSGLQQVFVPQQKSVAFGQQPQVVQGGQVNDGQLPVSPVTKKPSALTAQIRKSVGLNS